MAMYHLSAKAIRRKDGRSAVAAAAYRAGECIVDQRTGVEHDYTRKSGVLGTALLLPGGSTEDRSDFWNRVEKHHRRGDAVTAREVEVSLPHELDADQRHDLAMQFSQELADKYGVAVDVALHAPRSVSDRDLEKNPDQHWLIDPDTGQRHNGNWHAHILMTACHVERDGTLGKKCVEIDPIHCQRHKIPNMTDKERGRWCDLQNAALEQSRAVARVDHRSYKARGSDQVPTAHLGGYAARMRREGTPELSENATLNSEINTANREVFELRKQLSNERAEQHIEQKHQLQIRADLRALQSIQTRLEQERAEQTARLEAQEQREWDEWISRPGVCSATGRIITESSVDACIERERALPENQPPEKPPEPSPTASKPSPAPDQGKSEKPPQAAPLAASEPKEVEPQPAQPPAFDARARSLEIVAMDTPEERHAALHAASSLDLDDFDALSIELEPLMHAEGALTEEGQRLRAELAPSETSHSQRAERVQSEQSWEPPSSPGGPGF